MNIDILAKPRPFFSYGRYEWRINHENVCFWITPISNVLPAINTCGLSEARGNGIRHGQDMKDCHPMGQKIVSNNAPVIASPEHFRTHDRNSRLLSRLDKPDETSVKIFSKHIIRIIMKTLDTPEYVSLR